MKGGTALGISSGTPTLVRAVCERRSTGPASPRFRRELAPSVGPYTSLPARPHAVQAWPWILDRLRACADRHPRGDRRVHPDTASGGSLPADRPSPALPPRWAGDRKVPSRVTRAGLPSEARTAARRGLPASTGAAFFSVRTRTCDDSLPLPVALTSTGGVPCQILSLHGDKIPFMDANASWQDASGPRSAREAASLSFVE